MRPVIDKDELEALYEQLKYHNRIDQEYIIFLEERIEFLERCIKIQQAKIEDRFVDLTEDDEEDDNE